MENDNYIEIESDEFETVDDALIASTSFLIENGADVNAYGGMALEYACGRQGSMALVELLIDNGADVNINNGQPLYTASITNNVDLVELLLNHDADPSFNAYKAIKWASIYGYNEVVQLLLYNVTGFWIEKESDYNKVQKASKDNVLVDFLNNLKEQISA